MFNEIAINTLLNQIQNIESEIPIICLYGEIIGENPRPGKCFSGDIIRQLSEIDKMPGKKGVILMINSMGGGVMPGYDIIQQMLIMRIPVYTYVTRFACSIAGVISVYGNCRVMNDNAHKMLHDPFFPSGTQTPNQKKFLDKNKEVLVELVATRIGKDAKYVSDKMFIPGDDSYFNLKQCKELNLVDMDVKESILANVLFPNMAELENELVNLIYPENPTLNIQTEEQKKIITTKLKNMSIVNEALGLPENAGEGAQIVKITELKMEHKMSAKSLEDSVAKLKSMDDTMDAMKMEYAKLKDEVGKMTDEKNKKDAEMKATQDMEMKNKVKTDCIALVNDAVSNKHKILASNKPYIDGLLAKIEAGTIGLTELTNIVEGLPTLTLGAQAAGAAAATTPANTNPANPELQNTLEEYPESIFFK